MFIRRPIGELPLAAGKGFDMVVDTTVVLVFKPGLDITADALAAYNKAYPAK